MKIRLEIEGLPAAKQSVRFMSSDKVGNGKFTAEQLNKLSPNIKGKKKSKFRSYQPQSLKEYTKNAKWIIANQLPQGFKRIDVPVEINYTFVFKYTTDIKKDLRTHKLFRYKRPDIDNLQKAINDVLNNYVIKDDSMIAKASIEKVYGPENKTILEINEMEKFLWK